MTKFIHINQAPLNYSPSQYLNFDLISDIINIDHKVNPGLAPASIAGHLGQTGIVGPWIPIFRFKEFNVKFEKERVRRYRRYVYEAGAVNRPERGKTPEKYAPLSQANSTGQARVIGGKILERERKREFELSRSDRFRYRTRYFADSGVIGSKEFVSKTYMRFKHVFNSKNGKTPKAIKGLSGIYSLKRLSEVV